MSDPNHYRHRFATILPPSVDDAPICGATLAREWHGRGKADCPNCEAEYQHRQAARLAHEHACQACGHVWTCAGREDRCDEQCHKCGNTDQSA